MYVRKTMGDAPATSPVSDLIHSDAVTTGAGIALVYHGFARTRSIVWALLYGIAGKKLPQIAVPIAIAQGYGRRKSCPTD